MDHLAIIIIGLFFINGSSLAPIPRDDSKPVEGQVQIELKTSENRTETPLEAKLALENNIIIGLVVILLLTVIVLLCFLCREYKKEDPEKRELLPEEEVPVPKHDGKPSQENPAEAKLAIKIKILICVVIPLLIGIVLLCCLCLKTALERTENPVEAKLAIKIKALIGVVFVLLFIMIVLLYLYLKNKKKEPGKRELLSEEEEKAQMEKMGQLQVELRWRRTHRYAENITFNPDTAHPNLSVDGKKKSLKHKSQPQNVPPNSERFDSTVCVLGSEGFSGKHYWEVDVGSSTEWDLGVARKSIERKGKLSLSPKEGFWVLGFSGRDYWAKTDPWTRVMVQKKPKKIGVYLSCKDSQVTFYNGTDASVLFTFSDCSFTGEVCPFFKNSLKETTLRICSLREDE
nr:butyrophilin subfamily 2 member A2-like isoform X2 [Pelodiscus sinensis]|eukprot:XP_006122715.1 butyrophilin subfamily 2 member A2-like isoform X2 [Pelodiscus sinensis]